MSYLPPPKGAAPGFKNPRIAPNYPLEIDWSNPITRGMKICIIPQAGGLALINLVDSMKLTASNASGDISKVVTDRGVATSGAASNDDGWAFAVPMPLSTDVGTTIISLMRYRTTSTFAYGYLANLNTNRIPLDFQKTGPFSEYDDGFSEQATTLTLSDEVWHSVGWTLNSSGKRFFRDNDFEQTAPFRAGKTTTLTHVGVGVTASRAFIGNLGYQFAFERNLSDGEILSLQRDPFQVIKDKSLYFISSGAPSSFQAAWAIGTNTILQAGLV
jgi:hypothetical protein